MSDALKRRAQRVAVGSNYPAVNESDVRCFEVPSFPVSNQRAIGEILDTADDAIGKTKQLVAKLDQVKLGLLHDLMSRGIDENGLLRDRAERPGQFMESPIGPIPTTWKIAPLGSVVRRLTDGTHQAVTVRPQGDSGIPFLYVSCIRDGEVSWDSAASIDPRTYDVISRGREPQRGMTLYTAVGSYGHAALVEVDRPFAFQRHIACVYPQEGVVDPAFLAYWLDSPTVRRHADRIALGNAQLTVTLGELAKYPVPIPSLEEQREVARRLRQIEQSRQAERKLLRKLRMLRAGLAADLLSGAVRVTGRLEQGAS